MIQMDLQQSVPLIAIWNVHMLAVLVVEVLRVVFKWYMITATHNTADLVLDAKIYH
jgi:hypothetical protein